MKAIEAFKDLPSTNIARFDFTHKLKNELCDGEIDALQFKIFLKGIEQVIENIKPLLDQMAREQAEAYGQKSFDLLGAKVELREVGTKYDYTNCNYPPLAEAEIELSMAASGKKAAEKFLQSLTGSISINDSRTGEVLTVNPPIKSSTSSVVITLGKNGGANE